MEPSRAGRGRPRPALVLGLFLVLNSNYFLALTSVHCDRGHHQQLPHLKLSPNASAPAHADRSQLGRPVGGPGRLTGSAGRPHDWPTGGGRLITHDHQNVASPETISDQVAPTAGQHLPAARLGPSAPARPLPRLRRMAAARAKTGRRPPKSTTTTTTTTTTTPSSTTAPSTAEADDRDGPPEGEAGDEEEAENELAGDDYVDIRPKTTTEAPARATSEAATEEVEDTEAEYEDEEPTSTTSTTTTTTTTKRPTARKGPRKSKPKPSVEEDESKPAAKGKLQDAKKDSPAEKKESEPAASVAGKNDTQPVGGQQHAKKKPLVALPFIKLKNTSVCTPEAYLEFPRDPIGDKWRGRGMVILHVLVVCYMFYSLALVCERYFIPSLEEFAQRLQISEDVAGATLMSAGSSAPELFTAILGVFVAKGDVGTGAIVGSAVFNILFVIGVCAFVSSTSAQLQWWPVLRDSIYYTFTVMVLIVIIYDERITALESGTMILLYGLYIVIMCYNEQIKARVTTCLLSYPLTAKLIGTSSIQIDGPDDVFGGSTSSASRHHAGNQYELGARKTIEDDSLFMAACLVIIKHKRLFRSTIRFQSAARYIITKRQHRAQQERSTTQEVNYFGPEETDALDSSYMGKGSQRAKMEAYARSTTMSKQKFSIVSKDDYEFWHRPPEEGENYALWLARIPVNYLLHYTVPDCTLYPDKYIITFVASVIWTALFSYLMVWMVTLIGYTFGIPDSVMGVTFLAAGTSVPDCYSSIHAARNGMADMAVSNSIGSNVFDILIGLAVPWFIESTVYPGVVATINSRGVIYSVVLLFLSLIVTIYLLNKYEWSLQPRLGLALLIAYGLFIILTSMLEFNLFGHVNPPPCPAPPIGAS